MACAGSAIIKPRMKILPHPAKLIFRIALLLVLTLKSVGFLFIADIAYFAKRISDKLNIKLQNSH
jgi:hypothetical protein